MHGLRPGIRVALLAAMVQELRPIRSALALRPEALGGGRAYRGRAGSREVLAAVTSMGTAAATRATTQLLDAFPADHVVVVGIAGGVDRELRIGDLVSPELVVDEATGRVFRPTPMGVVSPRGKLLTTDTLYDEPAELLRLRREGFAAVDMETAAIAAVAEARELPWSVFRAISDRAGDPGLDAGVVGLARPDGSADPAAVALFVLTRPWRIPKLVALGRGMQRAIRVSSDAVLEVLRADRP